MIINIAIVEDDISASEHLKNLINNFNTDNSINFNIEVYENVFSFEEKFIDKYDLIFLDIEMPGKSGMELAKRIRERDERVTLIFATNLAQYAVEGYAVQAFDFMIKPLNENDFHIKFSRIINHLKGIIGDKKICVKTRLGETINIPITSIHYIEVRNHDLIFYLNNKEILIRGTMNNIEKQLSEYNFSRCNSCYLINLKYISKIIGDCVEIGTLNLKISQSRRKSFLIDFARYAGGTK